MRHGIGEYILMDGKNMPKNSKMRPDGSVSDAGIHTIQRQVTALLCIT